MLKNAQRLFSMSTRLHGRNAVRWLASKVLEPGPRAVTQIAHYVEPHVMYGQPTYYTHPHAIESGCLVPCVTAQEFSERRHRLMAAISQTVHDTTVQTNDHHLCVITSATKKFISGKIPYVFRQNSDFYYFTGCLEPDTVLLMTINGAGNVRTALFMRPKDAHSEKWDGVRTGIDLAPSFFGVDEAYDVQDFDKVLNSHLKVNKPHLWYNAESAELLNVHNCLADAVHGLGAQLSCPQQLIHNMRLFKSPAEIKLMRRTCEIASLAINEVMAQSRAGQSEHYLNALVDFKCRERNASYLAYPPVVAAGNNATTIHYVCNNQIIENGDLVLMDAGCEYAGYTSDITRTWPATGKFTDPQRVLYEILLALQAEMIATINGNGNISLDQLFDVMCLKLGKYLQEAGLLSQQLTSDEEYKRMGYRFCPHHISHYLGMDVHDTLEIPRSIRVTPGMVFTVEPGIYIPHEFTDVPEEFRGLGLRIEDDILLGSGNKVEVLTNMCIKDTDAIETLVKGI